MSERAYTDEELFGEEQPDGYFPVARSIQTNAWLSELALVFGPMALANAAVPRPYNVATGLLILLAYFWHLDHISRPGPRNGLTIGAYLQYIRLVGNDGGPIPRYLMLVRRSPALLMLVVWEIMIIAVAAFGGAPSVDMTFVEALTVYLIPMATAVVASIVLLTQALIRRDLLTDHTSKLPQRFIDAALIKAHDEYGTWTGLMLFPWARRHHTFKANRRAPRPQKAK